MKPPSSEWSPSQNIREEGATQKEGKKGQVYAHISVHQSQDSGRKKSRHKCGTKARLRKRTTGQGYDPSTQKRPKKKGAGAQKPEWSSILIAEGGTKVSKENQQGKKGLPV